MLVQTQPEVNVRAIRRSNGEMFVVLYSDENLSEARCCLGRMASNPELSFTWLDAARLAAMMHKRTRSAGEPTTGNVGMTEGDESEDG